ncbi:MAG: DUF29 domain-containing protein [Leptolyngbyaceae cyanobacterium bins.302]|nr:DUF29 domain-containing protein [Leptolyngbyaceae cyanobacterium bins.302]
MTIDLKTELGPSNLYTSDFYAWTQEQAELLQAGHWNRLDIPNLVEEIESLGKQEKQELSNRLGVLLGHLLKWEFQSASRSKSWFATIREQRRQILKLLKNNPSLQPYLSEAIQDGYEDALDLVVRETPLNYSDLPQTCPYEQEQVLEGTFLPGQPLESDADFVL